METDKSNIEMGVSAEVSVGEESSTYVAHEMSALGTDVDYATQFFGFTPKAFSDSLYNIILEHTFEHFAALERFISTQCDQAVVEPKDHPLLQTLMRILQAVFDKFENYAIKIFRIPNHVVLPEDAVQMKRSYAAEEEAVLDEEIRELHSKIISAKYVNGALRRELRDLDRVQVQYSSTEKLLETLLATQRSAGVIDMKESLQFVTGQLVEITQKLGTLSTPAPEKRTIEDADLPSYKKIKL